MPRKNISKGIPYTIAAQDIDCPSRARLEAEAEKRQKEYQNEISEPIDWDAEEERFTKYQAKIAAFERDRAKLERDAEDLKRLMENSEMQRR